MFGAGLSGGLSQVGSGNLATGQISIPVTAGGTQIVAARQARQFLFVRNTDAVNDLYIGLTGLTALTGYVLHAHEAVVLQTGVALFGLAVNNAIVVAFMELY